MFVTPRKRGAGEAFSPIELITVHRLNDVDFWRDGDSTDSESSDSETDDEVLLIDTSLTIATPQSPSSDDETDLPLNLSISTPTRRPSLEVSRTGNANSGGPKARRRSDPPFRVPVGLSQSLILRTPLFLDGTYPCLLSKEEVDDVYEIFPIRFLNNGDFHLIYSTREHGISLGTLYLRSLAARMEVSLLIIQTHRKERIGCFTTDAWRLPTVDDDERSSRRNRRVRLYYGSGECFVFSFSAPPPDPGADDVVSDFHSFSSTFRFFKWNKSLNRMFQYASPSGLGIGGPKFSLYIGSDLREGYSCACETFDSPALVVGSLRRPKKRRRKKKKKEVPPTSSPGVPPEYFTIEAVELWGFGNKGTRM